MNEGLLKAYASAPPKYNPFLLNYYFRCQYPKRGTYDFSKFMSLLKYLEDIHLFSRDELKYYQEER